LFKQNLTHLLREPTLANLYARNYLALKFNTIYGVDFSGAKLAGRNTWIAKVEAKTRPSRYKFTQVSQLEKLCGTAEREVALAHLVMLVKYC
jgi:hypothetical protein